MAAVELFESRVEAPERPHLYVVSDAVSYRTGRPLAQRRAARAAMLSRRRRTLIALGVAASLVVLAWPGHAFGGTTGAGLPTDLASSSTLASGMVYVVQPGDTVSSIARVMNPLAPRVARAALVAELDSSVVVPGEHVLIP